MNRLPAYFLLLKPNIKEVILQQASIALSYLYNLYYSRSNGLFRFSTIGITSHDLRIRIQAFIKIFIITKSGILQQSGPCLLPKRVLLKLTK